MNRYQQRLGSFTKLPKEVRDVVWEYALIGKVGPTASQQYKSYKEYCQRCEDIKKTGKNLLALMTALREARFDLDKVLLRKIGEHRVRLICRNSNLFLIVPLMGPLEWHPATPDGLMCTFEAAETNESANVLLPMLNLMHILKQLRIQIDLSYEQFMLPKLRFKLCSYIHLWCSLLSQNSSPELQKLTVVVTIARRGFMEKTYFGKTKRFRLGWLKIDDAVTFMLDAVNPILAIAQQRQLDFVTRGYEALGSASSTASSTALTEYALMPRNLLTEEFGKGVQELLGTEVKAVETVTEGQR